jgi:hypothetical protein
VKAAAAARRRMNMVFLPQGWFAPASRRAGVRWFGFRPMAMTARGSAQHVRIASSAFVLHP